MKTELKYKTHVEETGEYEYIRSYRKGDTLPNGKIVGDSPYIQVKHNYCGNIYNVKSSNFINEGKRCGKCCQKYENSFAYYIEKELGLKLEDVWDFEKNTVNPYHISKSSGKQVWIKCRDKNYHESYKVKVYSFKDGNRCPYCNSKKIHPKDSFAQYHIDNTDKDFLEKYWDWDKNILNPFEIPVSSNKLKVWIKCQNEEINELNGLKKKDYHGSYEIVCNSFTSGGRCSYCGNHKTHQYDSFGYHHFDKIMSWHPDNKISPFRVAKNSDKKYKFICETCMNLFYKTMCGANRGTWCPTCSSSKGEKRVMIWLDENNINYLHDKPYFKDLLSDKGNPLRPDFILPEHKIWIEYDGELHYKITTLKNDLKKQQKSDCKKNEYAKKHGWKLIRIPYWEFDNIEEILDKELKENRYE